MDCSFIIYLRRWRCISVCSKRWIYFNVPTCLKLLFAASATNLLFSCFFSSFYSPYVILLKIVLLIPLNSYTGNRNCRTIINIITSQPRCPYLPLSRGGGLVALVGVCIVWNLEPLASGGQSSPKLIPHIICQFLCARGKKLWTRTYSARDQVPTCPVFTRAKIKSRFGIKVNLSRHNIYIYCGGVDEYVDAENVWNKWQQQLRQGK